MTDLRHDEPRSSPKSVDTATLTETIREALTRFGSGQSGNRPNQRFVTDAERAEVALAALETRLEESARISERGERLAGDLIRANEAVGLPTAAPLEDLIRQHRINAALSAQFDLMAAEAREKALSEGIRRLLTHFVSPEEDVIPDVEFARALVGVRAEEKGLEDQVIGDEQKPVVAEVGKLLTSNAAAGQTRCKCGHTKNLHTFGGGCLASLPIDNGAVRCGCDGFTSATDADASSEKTLPPSSTAPEAQPKQRDSGDAQNVSSGDES